MRDLAQQRHVRDEGLVVVRNLQCVETYSRGLRQCCQTRVFGSAGPCHVGAIEAAHAIEYPGKVRCSDRFEHCRDPVRAICSERSDESQRQVQVFADHPSRAGIVLLQPVCQCVKLVTCRRIRPQRDEAAQDGGARIGAVQAAATRRHGKFARRHGVVGYRHSVQAGAPRAQAEGDILAAIFQCTAHRGPQLRQNVLLEPRVAPQPEPIPWTWVRQRKVAGRIFAPGRDRFRQSRRPSPPQMKVLRIRSDDDPQFDVGKQRQQATVPRATALRARWQVTRGSGSGKAKAHGHDGDPLRIVEFVAAQSQPVAQSISACVVPWYPGFVHFASGRLPGDENDSASIRYQDRARLLRQFGCADGTGAYLRQQAVQRGGHRFGPDACDQAAFVSLVRQEWGPERLAPLKSALIEAVTILASMPTP